MRVIGLIVLAGVGGLSSLICLVPGLEAQTPDRANPVLQRVLDEVGKKRREYVETFKELTAQETKLTEIFDDHERVIRKRKVVADFLVYPSQVNAELASEYRVVREVDGKPIRNHSEQGISLLQHLAQTKTLAAEHKRLREQNMKYNLHYYRWDVTLNPARQFEKGASPDYSYEIVGNERLGSKEVLVVSYRRNSFYPVEARGIFGDFSKPELSDRGRVWVDAKTFSICQWENELIVRHLETGNILVVMRDQVEYADSSFDILVPKTITISFFDKLRYKPGSSTPPHTELRGRMIYRYETFKRFNVTTEYELNKPPNP